MKFVSLFHRQLTLIAHIVFVSIDLDLETKTIVIIVLYFVDAGAQIIFLLLLMRNEYCFLWSLLIV